MQTGANIGGTSKCSQRQFDTPWTWQIGELFKIRDGKIDQVEALVMYATYGIQEIWTERPRWTPAH